MRRIAESFDLGNEHAAGVFTGVRAFSRRALETLPDRDNFEDLRDWLVPILSEGKESITAELLQQDQCTWEPVGTPDEYMRANFQAPTLPFFDHRQHAQQRGVTLTDEVVIGAGATVESGAQLSHCIVWDGETVPRNTKAEDGVFANGQFHSCKEHS